MAIATRDGRSTILRGTTPVREKLTHSTDTDFSSLISFPNNGRGSVCAYSPLLLTCRNRSDFRQPLKGQFPISLPLSHITRQFSELQDKGTTPHHCIFLINDC